MLEHLDEGSLASPVSKSLIGRRPRLESFRHVPQACTGAKHPQHAVEHQAIVDSWTAGASVYCEEISVYFPFCVGKFVSRGYGRILRLKGENCMKTEIQRLRLVFRVLHREPKVTFRNIDKLQP